uniref:Uncharacterized protein n=1 Tax=Arundo donax TaxID=35708 RepID=A0A0A8ZWY2_ARUDO
MDLISGAAVRASPAAGAEEWEPEPTPAAMDLVGGVAVRASPMASAEEREPESTLTAMDLASGAAVRASPAMGAEEREPEPTPAAMDLASGAVGGDRGARPTPPATGARGWRVTAMGSCWSELRHGNGELLAPAPARWMDGFD